MREKPKVLNKILYIMNLVGMNVISLEPRLWTMVKATTTASAILITVLGILIETFFNYQGFTTVAKSLEILSAVYQAVLKLWPLIFHRKQLAHLISTTQTFWSPTVFNQDQRAHINSPLIMTDKVFKGFYALAWLAFTQYLLTIYFNRGHLIFFSYGDQDGLTYPYYEIALGFQLFYIFHVVHMVIGYDMLFIYFAAIAISELRMVKIALGSCKLHDSYWVRRSRFKSALKHHVNVLGFIKAMNEYYEMQILQQFVSTLFTICFSIFMMTFEGMPPSMDRIQKYSVIILTYLIQIAQYCVAGAFLIHEGQSVKEVEFYKSLNAKSMPKYRFAAIMIIQRSQKVDGVSVGGFGWLNLESFAMIVRNSLSFCTFLQAAYKPERNG